MSWRDLRRRTRLDIVRGILVVGMTSAVAVFFTAASPADNPLGNPQDDSKIYRRTMEMVGGQANLVASDITDWVAGLWHGRTLACTLAVLTLLVAYGFFFITEDLPPAE
ncbi:MAG: hypothetical protein P4L36_22665 [Holophaga sp.]|nr:hypothetical protein [Holophaga sp.]